MTILDYDIFPYLFVYYSISICHIYCTLFIEKYNKSFCCSAINFRIIFFYHPHGMAKMRMKKKKMHYTCSLRTNLSNENENKNKNKK